MRQAVTTHHLIHDALAQLVDVCDCSPQGPLGAAHACLSIPHPLVHVGLRKTQELAGMSPSVACCGGKLQGGVCCKAVHVHGALHNRRPPPTLSPPIVEGWAQAIG